MLSTIGFGSRQDADRATAQVRAGHRRVRGVLPQAAGPYPAGTPYRADDPALLMWVLFTLADSAALVYRKYVRDMSRDEERALWRDYRLVGRLFGLADAEMPKTLAELDDYRHGMLSGDRLYVSAWARERARKIVLQPPVPWLARPVLETVNFITVALLPDVIREQYGFFPLPPVPLRRALVSAGAIYGKRAIVPWLPGRLRYTAAARAV